MPQSLFGHRRKRGDGAVRIDLQHPVVPEIGDIENFAAIEGNAVGTSEKIALRECRRGAIGFDLGDRIAAAVCDIYIARLSVDRDTYGPAEAVGDEGLRLALAIHLGDRIAVEIRLQEVALAVDRVARRTVKA